MTATSKQAYESAMAVLAACRHELRPCEVLGVGNVCVDCWNHHVAARRDADKIRITEGREAGRAYWAARGVRLGDTVYSTGVGIFGPFTVEGTAKAGRVDAYVTSAKARGKQLDPRYWRVTV